MAIIRRTGRFRIRRRMRRRIPFRRGRWSRLKPRRFISRFARKVTRIVRKSQELKFVQNTSPPGGMSVTQWYLYEPPTVDEGDTIHDRDGRKIWAIRWMIKFKARYARVGLSGTDLAPNQTDYRIVIAYPRTRDAQSTPASYLPYDPAGVVLAPEFLDPDKFRVVYDRTFNLNNQATTDVDPQLNPNLNLNSERNHAFYLPIRQVLTYNIDASSQTNSYIPFVLIQTANVDYPLRFENSANMLYFKDM